MILPNRRVSAVSHSRSQSRESQKQWEQWALSHSRLWNPKTLSIALSTWRKLWLSKASQPIWKRMSNCPKSSKNSRINRKDLLNKDRGCSNKLLLKLPKVPKEYLKLSYVLLLLSSNTCFSDFGCHWQLPQTQSFRFGRTLNKEKIGFKLIDTHCSQHI